MKFYNLFIAVLLMSLSVFADSLDCEGEDCEVQTCNAEIDTEYYCALSAQLGNYCENYVVVMETRADARILVKAKIVDSCVDCPTYHVDLSEKAFTTLTDGGEGQSDIIWGIYSSEGDLVRGPFYNVVDDVANSYELSNSSFIAAFKVLAGRIAANNISYGTFNITRGKNTVIRKVEEQPTQAPEAEPEAEQEAEQEDEPENQPEEEQQIEAEIELDENEEQEIADDATKEIPLSEVQNADQTDVQADNDINFDGENPDTISYDIKSSDDINTPKGNDGNYENAVILNESSSSVPVEDFRQPDVAENDDSQTGSGAAVSVLAISCVGAGAGLLFLKKKNPTKYDELKKKFPEAFSNVKRRASGAKNSKTNANQTLPTTNNYMPADTIEEDEVPRITVYDNQDPYHRN